MIQRLPFGALALMATLCGCLTTVFAAERPPAGGSLPDEIRRGIEAALPAAPATRPAHRKRVVLVTPAAPWPAHVTAAVAAIRAMGDRTGAFHASVTTGDQLGRVLAGRGMTHVLCFVGAAGGRGDADLAATKERFRRWLQAGRGVVAIHDGIEAMPEWKGLLQEVLGAKGDGRPWNRTVSLRNEEPFHALMLPFARRGYRGKARLYQFREPYSRDALRVLLSLNVAHTRMAETDPSAGAKPVHRTDDDFAVSWVRLAGKGRVFYGGLGGRADAWTRKKLLAHVLAGIQYAAGDLPADATPSAAVCPAEHPAADAAGFAGLLNGKDLSGWTCKAGAWAVENGAVVRKGGGNLWTKATYSDFVLDLEFQLARSTNSGVFLRCGDTVKWEQSALEIQLYDSYAKTVPGPHDCGALFDCAAPARIAARAPGRWNRMTITARGRKISVALNGQLVLDVDLARWSRAGKNPDGSPNKYAKALSDMPLEGHIGLQDHGYPVAFRRVRLRTLAK